MPRAGLTAVTILRFGEFKDQHETRMCQEGREWSGVAALSVRPP